MLTKLWEGVGSELIARWVAQVLTPAFLFWTGGGGIWLWSRGGWTQLEATLASLQAEPAHRQAALVLATLFLLISSGALARAASLPVLHLLEGYWPRWSRRLRNALSRRRWARRQADEAAWQALAGSSDPLSAEQNAEWVRLDRRLRRIPESVDRCMPTRLGNLLRASEARAADKYGLEASVCWPRLFLRLAKDQRRQLAASRARLDLGAQSWFWSALFLAWAPLAPWPAVGVSLGGVLLAYLYTLHVAETFGDLVEATFDLHRWKLYEALRWPLPKHPADERAAGREITAYLYRGSDRPQPTFVRAAE